jgi:hypothetical protein
MSAKLHFTAFPKTENNLKRLVETIDAPSFLRKELAPCSSFFKECRGRCCSLKVALTSEETDVLTRLCKEKKDFFKRAGLKISQEISAMDSRTGRRCLAKRRRGFSELNGLVSSLFSQGYGFLFKKKVVGKLSHVCIFSQVDGACLLQRLSIEEGRHPWYYKPINCWKYPISIRKNSLTLPLFKGDNHFPCLTNRGSGFAYEGLKQELEFLGCIFKRDILEEIKKAQEPGSP